MENIFRGNVLWQLLVENVYLPVLHAVHVQYKNLLIFLS